MQLMTPTCKTIPYTIHAGHRYPVGATPMESGTNFCVFSRHATRMQLLLYKKPDSRQPFQTIELNPEINRTFFFWHVFIEGLTGKEKITYTWKADGPDNPEAGYRFNPEIELLDPWSRATTDVLWQRPWNRGPKAHQSGPSMRAMALPKNSYDWQGDVPLRRPCAEEIIYELHVGGFTRHPNSEVAHPGTFSGVIEKIPYLKNLGINAIELLPVMAYDEYDVPDQVRDLGLKNYWGYATHSFFSPHPGYCVRPLSGEHGNEFRDMVKALHKAGISIILDVVYNHTAEGGADGPIINFKGMMNRAFYHLEKTDLSKYRNFSGCGNTVNCNHPLVARFILESLEYWVREFHVDGFRFDLASILARGEDGNPMYHAPVVWNIEFSDILAHTRLIAEAWDAGGLYQVGGFPGYRWAEWNGRYRDVVRRFVRGDKGLIAEFATRLTGSSDLYQAQGRLPTNSINFVTCHDGFTLYDLVSYNEKHNQANGENNRDGEDHNYSWNCGIEGKTDNPEILALRLRLAKNFIAILMLSQGVPMLPAGDEVLRSQQGNNNCYCQDNELSWFDWTLPKKNREMYRFTRQMIGFRKRHPLLMRNRFFTGKTVKISGMPDICWHGKRLHKPQWNDPETQVLACTISRVEPEEEDLHLIFNMSEKKMRMYLPKIKHRQWYRCINTSQKTPDDIIEKKRQRAIQAQTIRINSRSVVVLESR